MNNIIAASSEKVNLKPLLLCCRPEKQTQFSLDFLAASPGLAQWEAAVSQSAAELGYLRLLARHGPVFTASEVDRLLAGIERFDLLIVTPLSLNSLAKFALGLRDSFPSKIFGAMADLGRPIFIDISSLPKVDSHINPHYIKIYRRYWDNLQGGSIVGFTPETFSVVIDRLIRTRRALSGKPPSLTGRKVITRDDVLAAYQAMTSLVIPPGTLITDLAREEAEALGVQIRFE